MRGLPSVYDHPFWRYYNAIYFQPLFNYNNNRKMVIKESQFTAKISQCTKRFFDNVIIEGSMSISHSVIYLKSAAASFDLSWKLTIFRVWPNFGGPLWRRFLLDTDNFHFWTYLWPSNDIRFPRTKRCGKVSQIFILENRFLNNILWISWNFRRGPRDFLEFWESEVRDIIS